MKSLAGHNVALLKYNGGKKAGHFATGAEANWSDVCINSYFKESVLL
jgi:hypothetical protein